MRLLPWPPCSPPPGDAAEDGPLAVVGGDSVVYECRRGEWLTARYYGLSEGSLHFVKVFLPDGRELALPQILSASRARYTDDAELLWWAKGDSLLVEM